MPFNAWARSGGACRGKRRIYGFKQLIGQTMMPSSFRKVEGDGNVLLGQT
jgi:hypothetical protein